MELVGLRSLFVEKNDGLLNEFLVLVCTKVGTLEVWWKDGLGFQTDELTGIGIFLKRLACR